ncbi:glycerophosphodiester phosphodiesterase family protein [Saccharomonospora cyanea]|uniref:Glycerophosphoryl diester phosphodiesterase n=1 Tax=Saccharomonospora cyanea NA-134 TaxID=882082 RepID=H5XF79_9PSEU|nr:glycerophosphodiester phosphodiesterase family protein [Saccharomonospora cyanea]EHR61489.1 glycerophosphoryl diester phosphodiesterase [Saccharomonospora cyanea NA-134]
MHRAGADWLRTTPIAHRGLHDDRRPENSMPAFEAALRSGYGVELDIHPSADNRLVVMHDDDLARMTGTNAKVAALDATEVSRLTLLGTDATVPLLDDVLDLVDGRVPVLVEIKPGTRAHQIGPAVAKLLRTYRGPVAVQSFDPRIVDWFRRERPSVLRGQLAGALTDHSLPRAQKALLRSMAANVVTRPDFLAFDVDSMPSAWVSVWRRTLRVPLLLWTVRTTRQHHRAFRYGANVIFENMRPPIRS